VICVGCKNSIVLFFNEIGGTALLVKKKKPALAIVLHPLFALARFSLLLPLAGYYLMSITSINN
jgi:hypothetical protein